MSDGTKRLVGWAIVVAAIVGAAFLGVRFPVPEAPEQPGTGALDEIFTLGEETRAGVRPIQMRALNVAQDLGVGGDTDLTGDLAVGGDLALTGGLAIGAGYPVENPTSGRIVEFGATGAISSTAVTPVAITTVEAFGCTVNSPTAAAQLCYAVESGGVITFTIMSAAATPAAIVTPHAAGASFWIGGSD